jgi:hypothetical protein
MADIDAYARMALRGPKSREKRAERADQEDRCKHNLISSIMLTVFK